MDTPSGTNRYHRVLIVLSGGMDSSTVCAIASAESRELYGITFQYGQTLQEELDCARLIGKHYSLREHKFFSLDLTQIGGSALTDENISIPSTSPDVECSDTQSIPVTYVPARNTIFLSIALAWAEVLGAEAIYIGVTAVDYSGYPDCRPEFIDAFQKMADLATKVGVEEHPIKVETPLLNMSKSTIIKTGLRLGVPYQHTWSCYAGSSRPCGTCESCVLRAKGFTDIGLPDPALLE